MNAPRRWDSLLWHLQNWLVSLISRGGRPHPLAAAEETWESLALFYFADEQASRGEVDQLIRDALRSDKLPDTVSPRARYYLGIRIQCAQDFVGMAFPPQAARSPFGDLPQRWTDAQAMEWLLIDLWIRRYDHWLKLTAIGLYGPFAFYGIGPAEPTKPQ